MKEEVTIIGKIIKPEGVKGFLKLDAEPGFERSVLKAPFIFIYIDGLPIPFRVEECVEGKNILVKLEDVDLPEQAARYAQLPFGLHENHIKQSRKKPASSLEKLVGYTLLKEGQIVGEITEVARFPGQIMAIVTRQNGVICHIPLVSDWISEQDMESKTLHMVLPDGLLEV